MPDSDKQIAEELLERRVLRGDPDKFIESLGVKLAAHHRLKTDCLKKITRGEITRLIIDAPPGSGKSKITSVWYPAWVLANQKNFSVLAISHTYELAERWGRQVRDLINGNAVKLGIQLRPDTQAASRFATVEGGEFYAAGAGQAILGFRADVIIVDDIFRSFEDANSPTVRRTLFEWFESSLLTRLKPGGRVVIVGTRFHEDDLVGHLLARAERGGERWTVLDIRAIAEDDDILGREPGTWLWDDDPEWEYGKLLRAQKQALSPRNWAAMYQQRPAPEEGDYFQAAWFKDCLELPPRDTLRFYGGSDYATTQDRGDYTVHVVVGVDPDERLYLVDVWRAQTTPDKWIEKLLDMAERWKPMAWAEETGQIKSSIGPYIDKRSLERRVLLYRQTFPARHDKATRAQSIRARMAMDGLHCNMRAPWWPIVQQELLTFPAAKHDDVVDALGLVGQMLPYMIGQSRPRPKKQKSFLDDYSEHPNAPLINEPRLFEDALNDPNGNRIDPHADSWTGQAKRKAQIFFDPLI